MTHEMRLDSKEYRKITHGKKTIELRLLDEKREKVQIGDKITFTNNETKETITVQVVALHVFPSFKELYETLDKVAIGYREDATADYRDMEEYYSVPEQQKHGVIGIEFKKEYHD